MDPIEKIERALREIVDDLMTARFGVDWTNDTDAGLGADWAQGLLHKGAQDKKAQGDPTLYENPLSYSEFSELIKLINKHDKLFKPVFKKWDEMNVYFDVASRLRNTIKHHRDITPSQESLLEGIAGEIIDAISFWRIGANLNPLRITLEFTDYIPVNEKSEDEITDESKDCIAKWKELIHRTLKEYGLSSPQKQEGGDGFSYNLKVGHLSFKVQTNPTPGINSAFDDQTFKSLSCNLAYNTSSRVSLDDIIKSLGKQYRHITYDLTDKINIAALADWSSERAGLNPGSSTSINGSLSSIEFSLLQGHFRIGANNAVDEKGREFGRLQITTELRDHVWHPHNTISAQQLLGYMLGNITPKAILQLIRLSQI